jgi:hypothetical protein
MDAYRTRAIATLRTAGDPEATRSADQLERYREHERERRLERERESVRVAQDRPAWLRNAAGYRM